MPDIPAPAPTPTPTPTTTPTLTPTPTPTLTSIDDPVLSEALARLRQAERDREAAERAATAAKDELAATLFAAAAPYRSSDAPLPVGLIHTLYWELTDLRARDIASAFAVRVGRLAGLVGPRAEAAACRICGDTTEVQRRSRSDRPVAECPTCRLAREDAEREHRRRCEEWERDREREQRWRDARWERDGWDDGPDAAPPWWDDDESWRHPGERARNAMSRSR